MNIFKIRGMGVEIVVVAETEQEALMRFLPHVPQEIKDKLNRGEKLIDDDDHVYVSQLVTTEFPTTH